MEKLKLKESQIEKKTQCQAINFDRNIKNAF